MTGLTRTTVNLIPKAADALDAAMARDRRSQTDVLNRAIIAYDSISDELAQGNEIIIRAKDGTEIRWFLL
jgi:hypothetical protein